MFSSVEPVELGDLKAGDQIAIKGKISDLHESLKPVESLGIHYLHHGIFMGGYKVIDFSGEDKESAMVRKRDITKFMAGSIDNRIYRVNYQDGKCLPVNETLKVAERALAQGARWPEYHIFINNCESFATFLKTGVKVSVQALMALVAMITFAAGTVGSSVLSSGSLGSFGSRKDRQ